MTFEGSLAVYTSKRQRWSVKSTMPTHLPGTIRFHPVKGAVQGTIRLRSHRPTRQVPLSRLYVVSIRRRF